MSTTNVTNEVVRMTFEGGDFEKKIEKSLSALQKLKEHLSFKKATDEAVDNLSLMERSLDTLAHKAETIWDRTTSKIKDAISNKIVGALKEVQDMTINQLSAGWDKYAKKTEAVATLVGQGYDMDVVNREMELLNRYTDETSYAFTEMVQSIGKFTASGQSLEDANLAMQGIANWAALSGASATKASSAMYQLSQAMGKGALKLDDFKSIQNVGMDTQEFRKQALDAAVALGTLRRNADETFTVINDEGEAIDDYTFTMTNFTEYLSKGEWLTSDVMMKTFSRYSSAIANINNEIESERAEIASDAIKNLEDENDRIREQFKLLVGNLDMESDKVDDALNKWTQIQDVNEEAIDNYLQFNKKATREQAKSILHQQYLDNLKKFADEFGISTEKATDFLKESGTWTDTFGLKAYKAAQEAKTFKDAIESVKDAASTKWMNIWEKIFGDYGTAKGVWTDFANYLYDLLVGWLDGINDALKEWVTQGGRDVLMEAFGFLGEALMSIKELLGEVTSALFGEFTADKFMGITEMFRSLALTVRNVVNYIKNTDIIQSAARSIGSLIDVFKTLFSTLSSAYHKVFPTTIASIVTGAQKLNNIRSAAQAVSGVFVRFAQVISDNFGTFEAFFGSILELYKGIRNVISIVIRSFAKLLPSFNGVEEKASGLLDFVIDLVIKLSDILFDLADFLQDSAFLDKVREKTESVVGWIKANVYPFLKGVFEVVIDLAKILGGAFMWMGSKAIEGFKKVPWDKIKNAILDLKEKLAPVGDFIKGIGSAFKDGLDAISSSMKTFNDNKERSFFQRVLDILSEGFRVFKERVKDAWSSFKEVVQDITQSEGVQKVIGWMKKTFGAIKNAYLTYVWPVIKYIWEAVSNPIKKILDMLREGRISEILDLVKSALQINTLRKIANFFKAFTAFFKDAHLADIIHSISGTFHSISKMFDNLADTAKYAKNAVKAWKNDKNASALLKIVAVLAIVIGIVFALSFITPERAKKMGEAFVIVLSVALVVIGLLLAVSKAASRGGGSLLSVAAVFASIALAIILIAKVIKAMGEQFKTNTEAMVYGVITVIGIFVLLVGSMLGLLALAGEARAFRDNRLLGIAAIIASFGIAVALIATSFKKMGELKAEDFWQALAGVTILILALASATWLLNVQKSQKGTMALIGLVLVIRFLLIPTLRSIAKNKFDLGQALAAIFIPLLTLTGYIFAMTKIIKTAGSGKIIEALLILAAGLMIMQYTIIPALGSIQNGTNLASAGLGLFLAMVGMTAAIIAMVNAFELVNWGSLLKGAVGLTVGCLAISVAMMAMGQAIGAANGNEGFISMGLGMAAVLIAMAGAMALIGTFAPAAVTGASAILILAAAIAILTQAIIAFKKYVLGDEIGEITDAVNGVKPGVNGNKKTAKSGAITGTTKSKKKAIKDGGEADAVAYVEGVSEGMSSTKAKKAQSNATSNLLNEMSKSTTSFDSEDILKQMGIDTSKMYVDGLDSYDSIDKLLNGGAGITENTADGITSKTGIEEIAKGSDATVQSYVDELLKKTNLDTLNAGGEGAAGAVGEGAGSADMSKSASDLVDNLVEGLNDPENGVTINTGLGTESTTGTLMGMFGDMFGNSSLQGSGASLVESLTGGMKNGSLVDGFISGAVDDVVGKIKARFNTWAVDKAEEVFTPFLYAYDKLFGTDYLDTGKADKFYNALTQNFDKNRDAWLEVYYSTSKMLPDSLAKKMVGNMITSAYGVEYSKEGMDRVWKFFEEEIDKVGHNGSGSGGRGSGISEITVEAEAERQKMKEILDELYRLDEKYANLKLASEKGELTSNNVKWLQVFGKYLDDYNTYVLETKDTSVKYEEFVDAIVETQNKLEKAFEESYGEDKKLILKENPFDTLMEQFKEKGNVTLEYSEGIGSNIVKGFNKGVGDGPQQTADHFFNSFDETFRDNRHFGIHSPSTWGEKMFMWIMESFALAMVSYMKLLDMPLLLLRLKISNAVVQMVNDVQYLLDNANLEMKIVPVLDMDNMQYIIGGIRLDKTGNVVAGNSYGIASDVSRSSNLANDTLNMINPKALMDLLTNMNGKLDSNNSSSMPPIEIYNSVGVDTVIKEINKDTRMNGGKLRIHINNY